MADTLQCRQASIYTAGQEVIVQGRKACRYRQIQCRAGIQADRYTTGQAGRQVHYRAGRKVDTLQGRQSGRYTTGQADIVQGRKTGR